ncbi:MAG: type IV pilus secretin PilQ [Pseudomonadota bacterium]
MEKDYLFFSKSSLKCIINLLSIFFCALIFSLNAHAENKLNDISIAALPDDQVEITLEFSSAPTEPLAFTTDNPARIALDFANTELAVKDRFQDINIGPTKTVNAIQSKDRTRIVVNLDLLQEYQVIQQGNNYILTIGDATATVARKLQQEAPQSAQISSPSTGTNNIDLIDFRRGDGDTGRIMVSLTDSSTPVTLVEQGGRIILNFSDSTLAADLQKRFDVTDFATPINSFEARSDGPDVQITVLPNTDIEYEHLAYQTNNLYILEVQKIPEEIIQTRRRETYDGERLSLNFQNIEVRSVLQLIADFTGLNLVVSDSVGGSLTLRLKNVPWDQALDIILRTKGLDMRENGNVLYIAPSEEIAAREKLELESQQQVEELAPLRSEFIQINYASATDLAELLKDGDNTLLSTRGQVSVDQRTNTLLVQDTAQKLGEIRRLIERLDIAVKQVLIETRIVNANDDFSKDLGARFGVFNVNQDLQDADGKGEVVGGNLGFLEPIRAGTPDAIPLDDTLNVNLPIPSDGTSGGQFAFSFIKLPFGYSLNLELSAAQAESRAEIVSNPRVITANQSTARIESGTEIPFQSATSSGATDVEFKKAVLSLEVTPQITPDDRINMQVNVTNDTVGELTVDGTPSIDTNEIESNVLVDNGQTVVLGGIYTENSSESEVKVPFFGDLPVAGRLFRRESINYDKSELLIFITPKIIDEELNLTR